MTLFTEDDFKEVQTHDGFISRDKDFIANLDEYVIQPVGKKDTLALSLRFSDDPEGEKLLNIFGIDQAKDGSYNKKFSMGAFFESLKANQITVKVARKIKEGTNTDDPQYDYAIKFSPEIKGKALSMHLETSKYTKDGAEKESQTWTVAKIGTETVPATPVANNNDKLIEAWRNLICDPEKTKILGLPGTKKNIILNLKKIIIDVKQLEAMQTVRDTAMDILAKEGLIKIEAGVITPL